MQGKRGVILGVANNRSIAWGIAKACHDARRGDRAHLAGRRAEEAGRAAGQGARRHPARPLRRHRSPQPSTRCSTCSGRNGARSISWCTRSRSPTRTSSTAAIVETTADNFSKTMLISCYSLTAIAQRAEKLLTDGGSILTLTYYGAEKVDAALQRDGRREGGAGSERALSRRRSRREEHPRQRDLGRSDQDAGRVRHRRFPLHSEVERVQRAAAPHRDDRGSRRQRRFICCPTCRAASPARCTTSIPAITSSA